MEEINKAIEVLQAINANKVIKEPNGHIIAGIGSHIDDYEPYMNIIEKLASLKIEKEPTYRPYANVEEFLKASKEHGPYVKVVGDYRIVACNNSGVKWVEDRISEYAYLYDQLLENGLWQDGTPCGILE